MGFGLLLFGYMTLLGFFPDLFIYNGYGIFIAAGGGIINFAAYFKLQEYNIYFKIMKYISVAYILILCGFAPVLLIKRSDEFMYSFTYVSKIIRILFLFAYHYIMLCGIRGIAQSAGNIKISKSAEFNIKFTYVYFGAAVLSIFDFMPLYYGLSVMLSGVIYYFKIIGNIHDCFVRITYKGHDEEAERKKLEKKLKKDKKDDEN